MKSFVVDLEFIGGSLSSTDNLIFQAECCHYLFDAAVKLYQSGLDRSTLNYGPILNSRRVSLGHQNVNISVKTGSLVSSNDMEPSRVSS